MAEYKGVMVYCETSEGKLATIALEMLGGGRKLANDLGEQLYAVVAGSGLSKDISADAIAFGADKVYVVDDPLLKTYETDAYTAVMEKIAKDVKPQVLLMGQTALGRDLAPRLAFRLGTTATLDCIEVSVDPASKRLQQSKPVYGGNAQAVFVTETNPQIATIRVKTMSPLERDSSRKGEVVSIAAGLAPAAIRTKVLEKVKEEVAGIKLEDADVVIAGGRGIGSAEGFKELEKLAKLLKGAVGASRPPCDSGWVPTAIQVGLTGKIVAPTLYIAVALSGSSQHMSGCSGSKNIIAINKDPESNIVKLARYAVVGDWKKVVPVLAKKVEELLAG